jgi:hypothetical protein
LGRPRKHLDAEVESIGYSLIMANPPTHLACPTEIVEAPVEVVWKLLLNTAEWGKFYDVRVFLLIHQALQE